MSAVNRIATHLDAPNPTTTPAERSRAWSDALFAAVAALQNQLSHPNAEVAREAAFAIIDLEKTRLRHDRELAGTECVPLAPRVVGSAPLAERVVGSAPLAERVEHAEPHTACADHSPDPLLSASPEDQLALLDRMSAYIDTMNERDDDDLDELDEEEEAVLAAAIAERLAVEQPEKPPRPTLAERFQARVAEKTSPPAPLPSPGA